MTWKHCSHLEFLRVNSKVTYYHGTEILKCIYIYKYNFIYIQCVQKKVSPLTVCTDKCKHAPYWTKLSMHSPRSIWVIVAKFHTIPSYHLTDFQFYKLLSQISVTDMTCLLHITHDTILLIILIKVLRVEKGYGAKRIMTEFPERNFLLASVKRLLHQIDTTGSADHQAVVDVALHAMAQTLNLLKILH